MNKYHINRQGITVDQYGRVLEYDSSTLYTKKGKRKKLGNKTVAVKLQNKPT